MQAYLPTDGVSFEAVKEQLILLGHDIPDHVIRTFLKDGSTQPAEEVAKLGTSAAQQDARGNNAYQTTDAIQRVTSGNASDVCLRISVSKQDGAEGSLDQRNVDAQRQPDIADCPDTICAIASLPPRLSDVDSMPVSKDREEPLPGTPSGSPHWPGAPASDLSQEHEGGVTGDHTETEDTAVNFDIDSFARMSTAFSNLGLHEDVSGSGVEDLAEEPCAAQASHTEIRETGFSEGYQDMGSHPPNDATATSAGAEILHACESRPEHNNISSDASQGTVPPSVLSERPSMPFANVYASADGALASSQTEVAEGFAALELDACPLHGDMACPWDADEGSLTEGDPLDAYTGMYADLAARAAALAAELPGDYGLPPSSPTSCDAYYYIGAFQGSSSTYLDGLPPDNFAAAEPFSGSGAFPGSGAIFGSDPFCDGLPPSNSAAADAYMSSGALRGSSAFLGSEQPPRDPQPRVPSPSWSERLWESSSRSHEGLGHEAPSGGRSAPGMPGPLEPGSGREQIGAAGAFERFRGNAGESARARLPEKMEQEQRVPWHELLLHAPLYPERDTVERLSAAENRSPRFTPRGAHQRVGQSRQPAQRRPCAHEWDDDVSMGRRPERRPVVADVAADVASSRGYSSGAASPGRDRPRRSRFEAPPDAAAQRLHVGPVPDLACPLEARENGVRRSKDSWSDQNRPQTAPQRSAAVTPRSSAGTARSLVTRIKGPRKMDRVARWRQLQETWARDPFLRNGAAGGNKDGKRKKMGFREAFAEVHAANDEMRSLYVQLAASSATL
ncbi:hypothetical protein COCOBI_18-0510 [Coccomyxa sp. Obi]|nr:hypothetical protein COCOBI_18-0510 [Coccomyxa sp. Obi]